MIFAIVGTQRFPFNRMFELIDEAIEAGIIEEEVVAQSGYTEYQPRNFTVIPFLAQEEMNEYVERSRCIISHAGVGSITNCLERGKPVIVIPRRKEWGEHVDDHQLEISKVFQENGYVAVAESRAELQKLVPCIEELTFQPYVRKQSDLISSIKNYVNSL
ncbi:PssE/Cps14G family polysaccharide biosynthesis glycosyltransferase [Paenibacillus sp. W4I10]|uniref:PssE/Cps14G family polysaccharide biosynthesis glycosyltransferase n=1 Tax=Paenibacillus TaxID=44249 RepID=UPI002783E04C|nr:PssE/Cps14G family polysaccharide biosynthesis glycosyltransferase [Paenibacillus sp. W4I10]MDQ0722187.1 UDP-N-acetylglucosamine transferase subunit ALG13 [Paenibacillus sp. W4I10]